MIWDRLCLKTQCLKLYDLRKTLPLCLNCKENLGILEDAVWSPNWIDPLDIENPELDDLKAHIFTYFHSLLVLLVLHCLIFLFIIFKSYFKFLQWGLKTYSEDFITYSPLPCSVVCAACGLSSWGPGTCPLQMSSRSNVKKKIQDY